MVTAPNDIGSTVVETSADVNETRTQLPSALMIDESVLSSSANELGYVSPESLAFTYSMLVDNSCTVAVAAIALPSLLGVHK